MPKLTPTPSPVSLYNPALDSDILHAADYVDGGVAMNAVRYIIPDREAVARRNIADIQKSIELRKQREAESAHAA